MKTVRAFVWRTGIAGMALLPACPAIAQPEAAAWTGISPRDPTDYGIVENWIDLVSGQVPSTPPDQFTDIFFDRRAGQAPRDPQGDIVVAVTAPGATGGGAMTVESLSFRLTGGGFLDIVDGAGVPNSLVVQDAGALTLDDIHVLVHNSIFVGGDPGGQTIPASLTVLPNGQLETFQTLNIRDGSTFDLRGGRVTAAVIDTGFDPQRFRWSSGALSFDEFTGDLFNPGGDLFVGRGFNKGSIIHGSYFQEPAGSLFLDLEGNLNVEGTLHAGGVLNVSRMAMIPPLSAGEEFDVLDFASLEGEFAEVLLPQLPPELGWDSSDLHTEGVLRLFDAVIPLIWSGTAGDGDYLNPKNWEQGILPINTQDQVFSVTLADGADVTIPANASAEVTRLTQTASSAMRLMPGSEMVVTRETTLSGFTSATGPGARFAATGAPAELLGAPQLVASEGGTIVLAADRYDVTAEPATSTLITADGLGASIELAAVDAITVDVPTDRDLRVAASNGGEIDLSGLSGISGVTDGDGQLVLRATSGGTLRLGAVAVSSRASLEAEGPDSMIDVAGGLVLSDTSGVRLVDGGTITFSAPLLNRGTVSGSGMLTGTVFNDGTFSPGGSPGELNVCGDLVTTENGIFVIEIAGRMPATEHDKVTTCRRMTLNGNLLVTLIDGGMGVFEPVKGDEFELFSAAQGVEGTFELVRLPVLPPELGWHLLYEEMGVSLRVASRLPGDFDADGDVDRDDLAVWQGGNGLLEGASQTDGDADGDRDVDGSDVLDYLLHFGTSRAAGLAAPPIAVPEPDAALAAGLLAAVCLARSRFSRGFFRGRMVGRPQEQTLCTRTTTSMGPLRRRR